MNLREDNEITTTKMWMEARNNRVTKEKERKKVTKEMEEQNFVLINAFSNMMEHELKESGCKTFVIKIRDHSTEVLVRTKLYAGDDKVYLRSMWNGNMLTSNQENVEKFIGNVKDHVANYKKEFPELIEANESIDPVVIVTVDTRTKFFK